MNDVAIVQAPHGLPKPRCQRVDRRATARYNKCTSRFSHPGATSEQSVRPRPTLECGHSIGGAQTVTQRHAVHELHPDAVARAVHQPHYRRVQAERAAALQTAHFGARPLC